MTFQEVVEATDHILNYYQISRRQEMTIDQSGRNFIKSNEGYQSKPYMDNGKLAWGYGHDQQPGEVPPSFISTLDADALLDTDLTTRFEPAINAHIPPKCTQNQYNALCDMAYNDGPKDVVIMLSHGWSEVPTQLPRWCYETVKGIPVKSDSLLARRIKEVELFTATES
jgi:GH24 family phage-related lysozyme (muramidase)